MTYTHTYATMKVSAAVHEEIKQRLLAAGCEDSLHDDGATLDMHGIALTVEPQRELNGGTLEVGNDGRNVVVNHPDLKPDEKGVGHIVFSAAQAENFATLLLRHAAEISSQGASFRALAHKLISEGVVGDHIREELVLRVSKLLQTEIENTPVDIATCARLPDDGISVLVLGDLDGWTVASLEDGEWVEDSTGDRITALKWLHLPAGEGQ